VKWIACSTILTVAFGGRRSAARFRLGHSGGAKRHGGLLRLSTSSRATRPTKLTAELAGMDEKNIEVKLADGGLTIKGEKQEEKEEKKKDYYLSERHFGSFERSFRLPDGVDTNKIEATFKQGVLRVTLPKTPEAQRADKKITVTAA
jgi:hypothetical protein